MLPAQEAVLGEALWWVERARSAWERDGNQMKGDEGMGRRPPAGEGDEGPDVERSSGIVDTVLNWLKQQAIDKGKDIQSREARGRDARFMPGRS